MPNTQTTPGPKPNGGTPKPNNRGGNTGSTVTTRPSTTPGIIDPSERVSAPVLPGPSERVSGIGR